MQIPTSHVKNFPKNSSIGGGGRIKNGTSCSVVLSTLLNYFKSKKHTRRLARSAATSKYKTWMIQATLNWKTKMTY